MEFSSKNNSNPLNLGLGKILAAAAWMDGNLKDNELERLTALVLQMPNISFEDWRKLKIYLAYPINASEKTPLSMISSIRSTTRIIKASLGNR